MNEQIRLLAEQAEEYAAQNATGDWEVGPAYQDLYNKKFAELIVREAIGVCRVDVDALTSPFLPEYEKGIVEGYRRANENLRFLFGVEE
jgi:hypothetical protein